MNLALVVISDGRGEFLDLGLASLDEYVDATFSQIVVVDDSGDSEYGEWLEHRLDGSLFVHHERRLGLAQAIRSAWAALDATTVDYVLHLEDDCIFTRPVSVDAWVAPFVDNPALAQVCLQRAAQAPSELAAGTLLGFLSSRSPAVVRDGWTEGDWGFSLQPNIYPASVTDVGWPEHGGETEFTGRLLVRDPGARFAYLGEPDDAPHYEHVGFSKRSPGWVL